MIELLKSEHDQDFLIAYYYNARQSITIEKLTISEKHNLYWQLNAALFNPVMDCLEICGGFYLVPGLDANINIKIYASCPAYDLLASKRDLLEHTIRDTLNSKLRDRRELIKILEVKDGKVRTDLDNKWRRLYPRRKDFYIRVNGERVII